MRQYIEDREGDRARGRLIGVGVGPGDPSLLTLKAIQTLQNADYVAYPTSGAQADGSKASNLALARLDTLDFLAVFRFEEIYPQSFPCFSHLWEYINYHSTYP